MSVIEEHNCHENLHKDKRSMAKVLNRKLSLTQAWGENEVDNWKKSYSTEVAILRNWLKKQPHLPQEVTDQQMLTFLHSCNYSLEQTKSKIDSHFTIRTHAPEIFGNRSFTSKELLLARQVTRISPLRFATPEGDNIIFIEILDPDVKNFDFLDAVKVASLAIDVLVHCFPQEKGNVLVFDMKNSALAHVMKTDLVSLKKSMLYVQKALPFILKRVHVINAFPLIQQIQMMLKPFIDENLSKMIHIHMQDNMESFYKFIPRSCLPKEYGGELESLKEHNEKLNTIIMAHESLLKSLDNMVVDESKRQGKMSSELFGVEGSFRKLEID